MPGIYRKKRRNAGPSKNEEKVERARQAERLQGGANLLSVRFPDVQSLTVKLTFSGAQGQFLADESRTFGPQDPCSFAVPCPGRCGVGSFDLAAKIGAIVTNHELESRSSGVCQEKLFAGAADMCQCKLDCVVTVVYR